MNRTKKGFLTAGGIISIVLASLCLLEGLVMFTGKTLVTEDFVKEMFNSDSSYTYFEDDLTTDEVGDYYFEYTEQGTVYKITKAEIKGIVNIASTILTVVCVILIALAVANLIFAIFVLKGSHRNNCKKGFIITLLVLSVLSGNLLTMAFMIVALCIKDTPQIEHLEDIPTTYETGE